MIKFKLTKNTDIIAYKFLLIFLLAFLTISCSQGGRRSEVIYLSSKDKSQVLSIISNYANNERIIAVGKVTSAPLKNYVKLNISEVTELADEIGVCWSQNGNGWQLVNDKAKIIKTNLDTRKYIVKTAWYEDDNKIPNTKYYTGNNCFTVGTLDYSKVYPADSGFVERR